MNFRDWWLKNSEDVLGYGVANTKKHKVVYTENCPQEEGSSSVVVNMFESGVK